MPMEAQFKFTKVFDERVKTLVADHYCKRLDTRLPNLWFVRLKHMSNGNEIILRGYPADGVLIQSTNGAQTHREVIQ